LASYRRAIFYSPLPSLDEIKKDESKIFRNVPRNIDGLDLHEAEQLNLLEQFLPYYKEMPHQPSKSEGLRYYFEMLNILFGVWGGIPF